MPYLWAIDLDDTSRAFGDEPSYSDTLRREMDRERRKMLDEDNRDRLVVDMIRRLRRNYGVEHEGNDDGPAHGPAVGDGDVGRG